MKNHVVVLLVLAGCNSGPSTPTQLYHSLVDATCNVYVRCGTIGKSEQSTCQSSGYKYYDTLLAEQTSYDFNAAVAAKRVAINGSAVNTCLAAYGNLSCNSGSADPEISEECSHIYTGMVAMGGTCQDSIECATGFCQQNAGSATCAGVCVPFFAEGASCTAISGCDTSKDSCTTNGTTTDLVCAALPGNGEPCGFGQCQSGLVCFNGTCGPVGTVGAACLQGTCGSNLYCPAAANPVCMAVLKTGDDCSGGGACQDGDICAGGLTGGAAKCASVLDIGSSCDPTAPACPSDSTCDETKHVCVAVPSVTEGTACTPGSGTCTGTSLFATEMYCDATTNVCADLLATGAPCDPSAAENGCAFECGSTTKVCSAPITTCP